MKAIVFIGIFVLALFLVGCGEDSIAGEAFKFEVDKPELKIKEDAKVDPAKTARELQRFLDRDNNERVPFDLTSVTFEPEQDLFFTQLAIRPGQEEGVLNLQIRDWISVSNNEDFNFRLPEDIHEIYKCIVWTIIWTKIFMYITIIKPFGAHVIKMI